MRRPWLLLAAFAIALSLRVGLDLLVPRPLASDEIDYDRLGSRLARTGRYWDDGHPTAYRQIGYPLFVAAVYSIAGRSPFAVKVAQAACDAGVAVVLFLILAPRGAAAAGASLPAAATVAMIAWALFPPAILHAGQLFSESLFTFLVTLFTFGLVSADDSRPGRAFVAGGALGLAILVKWTALPIAVALPLLRGRPYSLRTLAAIVAIASVLPLIWLARNERVLRAPVLSTNMGVNLLIGNHPGSTGGYGPVALPPEPARRDIPDTIDPEIGRNDEARRLAVRYIAENPLRFAAMGLRKMAIVATSEGELVVGLLRTTAEEGPGGFARKLRAAPIWLHLAVSVPYAALVLLGTLGLGTREQDLLARLFLALLVAIAGTAFVFFGSSRFHFPLMPFMTLFAAEFVAEWRTRIGRLATPRAIAAIAVCAALVTIWGIEIAMVYRHA